MIIKIFLLLYYNNCDNIYMCLKLMKRKGEKFIE